MKLPFVLARRFVAGETLESALPAVDAVRARGLNVSLDLLGENVTDRATAATYTEVYTSLLEMLAAHGGAVEQNISIKLSMIGQRIDEEFCVANLERLLERASAADAFVRLDMEGSDLTHSTLDIFERVFPRYRNHVGVVLQSYLHRTDADVDRMIELQARVRLCKGAYNEPADVAYQDMPRIRHQFIGQMKRLIEHGYYPAIATHDDEIIDATKAFVVANEIDRGRFEFQMLYGIRTDTHYQLAAEGYQMRVYIPYGTQWLPYFSRRLRERRENVWFVLKNLFKS